VVEYELPLPEDPKGFSGTKDYQSKDLDCALNVFKIKKDGTVWIKKVKGEWTAGNPKSKSFSEQFGHFKVEKEWEEFYEHTFTANLCGYETLEGPYDYWIDYKISVVDGVLDKVSLEKFEAIDNSKRKKLDKEITEQMVECKKLQNTFRYKYFYKYYNRFIRFSFKQLYRVINFVSNNLWSLERKLLI
jgi:hypothetical protein